MGQVPALFVNGQDTQIVQVHAACPVPCPVPCNMPYAVYPRCPFPSNTPKSCMEQSNAIICYLGKLSGLYPTDDHLLAARVDMLLCGEADMFTGVSL